MSDLISDPIGYEQYVYRLTKFREEKLRNEKKNEKILNFGYNENLNNPPRILNNLNYLRMQKKIKEREKNLSYIQPNKGVKFNF